MANKRQRRDKWAVWGEYGGQFTNLGDALANAKECSLICPDEEIDVYLLDDGCYYFTYVNGKCTYDGWTRRKEKKAPAVYGDSSKKYRYDFLESGETIYADCGDECERIYLAHHNEWYDGIIKCTNLQSGEVSTLYPFKTCRE